jgi:hypothetical protein
MIVIIAASIAAVMTAIFITILRYTSQSTKVQARRVSTMVVLGSGDL